jgi:hypothetical protein
MSFHTERDCDAISLHSPNWTSSTSAAEAFRRYAVGFAERPAKPLLFTEPVPEYQGDASLHDAMMRLMWGTLLGGAGFVVQNDTSYGYAPRSAMAAQSACRDAVLDLEGHAARFFNASGVNFASMAPNELLASTGVCLANPGREYVVYAQSGTTVTLELPAATGDVTVRFYNPRTGRFQPAFTATGNGPRSFTKPDAADWVMHVTVPRGPSSG